MHIAIGNSRIVGCFSSGHSQEKKIIGVFREVDKQLVFPEWQIDSMALLYSYTLGNSRPLINPVVAK